MLDETFLIWGPSAEAMWLSMCIFNTISQMLSSSKIMTVFWSLSLEFSSLISTQTYRKRNLAKTKKKKERKMYPLFKKGLNMILTHPYWNLPHVKFQRTFRHQNLRKKTTKNINLYLSARKWLTPFLLIPSIWESPVKQFPVTTYTYMCVCTRMYK